MGRNFNQMTPLPTKPGPHEWGRMEWLVDDSMVADAGMSAAVMVLETGKSSPFHRHPNCNEILYLLEGNVEVTQDKGKVVLEPGDSILSPLGTAHGIRNLGQGDAKMFVAYSEGRRIYEAVEGIF